MPVAIAHLLRSSTVRSSSVRGVGSALTREPVYTAKDLREKKLQKALLLYWDAAHHDEARESLIKAGRGDLIGTKPHCLVRRAAGKGGPPRYLAMFRG